ncbi:MAG TPA: hypothetical protein VKV05_00380 [Terriglobales bacterium]|nr:hypothetical protein [Terriglobales bacterium]
MTSGNIGVNRPDSRCRVYILRASVSDDARIPAATRLRSREDPLTGDDEVRVTAEEDNDGEWRNRKVEILKRRAASN